MFFEDLVGSNFSFYKERRERLVQSVKNQYSGVTSGLILLFADFEDTDIRFRQESTFYYFTGIEEPGVVVAIDLQKESTLFIPNCVQERKKWIGNAIEPTEKDAQHLGFEKVSLLGDSIKGLQLYPYFVYESYGNLLQLVSGHISKGNQFFVLYPNNNHQYIQQRFVFDRMKSFIPILDNDKVIDISPVIATMRRKKDIFEIGKISEAINLTALAHDAAARMIKDEVLEGEIQAAAEYMFTAACAKPAYPSIVASGNNGTILHYHKNCSSMNNGDLVLVDIGAKYDNYCADITRTYPVSGYFSERQKELYTIVLEAQKYMASVVKPGYFLNNPEQKDKSLSHLAKEFFDEKGGYGKYFTHGIGHYLGLDVHDVGNVASALESGDVITIEPGLYIPEEGIGIRIEDNYWIKNNKAICLSDMIPKEVDQVEQFMREGLSDVD